jgi:hypothetical protein
MRVESLGYVCARTKNLDDWASYGPGLLGLQRVDKSRDGVPHGRSQAADCRHG